METATIGHNNPPSDIEVFGDRMKETYGDTFNLAERLIGAEDRIPAAVDNDIDAGKLGDFIKQVKHADKSLNSAREGEKEVYLKGSRMVDGFFNSYREKLKKIVEKASGPLAEYQKKKEDEERRRREEEAEKKRLEAEAILRESERKRKEAEEKERLAKEEQRLAAEAAAKREAEIKAKAEAEKAAQQAEIDRLNAEKAQQEKVDAETKAKLKEAEEKLKQISREEKAELKEVKAELEVAEDAANEIAKQAKADNRESNKLLDSALRADKQAEKLDKLADKNAADLSRVRGLEGSVATVSTSWVGDVTDDTLLDKNALWAHINIDAKQTALNSWVKANPGKQMPGAYIREEHKAQVR